MGAINQFLVDFFQKVPPHSRRADNKKAKERTYKNKPAPNVARAFRLFKKQSVNDPRQYLVFISSPIHFRNRRA
jgi:hypothetical protein